jgi:iron complex outermembrane recepter protein
MNLLKKSLLSSAVALLLCTSVYADELVYSIESQSLKDAIETISKKSNTPYIVKGALLEDKKSNAIKEVKGTKNALNKLLENSGLEAVIEEGAIIIQESKDVSTLNAISISAGHEEGTANEGYLVKKTTAIGPWQGKSLQDTPYAINVTSEELIENLQAISTDQIYNINPVMQVNWNESQNNNGYVFLRGFQTSTSAFDGMRREKWQFTHNLYPEEYERLETITGLSGFLYGASSIGGMMNYVSKRPTNTDQHSITVGTGGEGYYIHTDLSGPIDDEGKFGYRLNVMKQDSDTNVDYQNLEKSLVNLALDWHVTDELLLQTTVTHSEYRLDGTQNYWYIASGATRPSASTIDANKLWAQKWAYNEAELTRYSTNATWNISDHINLRAAYMHEKVTRAGVGSENTVQTDGTYTQSTVNYEADQSIYGYGAYTFIDFAFDTGWIKHQLTTGVQLSDSRWTYSDEDTTNATVTLSGLTLNAPIYVSEPEKAAYLATYSGANHLRSTNFILGDSIELTQQWSLLAGVSHVELEYKDTDYKKSALTPSVSLVYKPFENLSIYTSYMEGLETGGVAGDTYGGYNVANAKAVMGPLMSEQIEIGAKWTLDDLLLTAALFQIDKGLEYYDLTDETKPRYVQDGRQVHKGLETTFTGKVTERLTLLGGFTYLDAKVKENKENPLLEGKRPIGVAEEFAKMYVEYAPFTDPNIVLNAGVNYTGSFYGDSLNTDRMPSYTLFNTGVRYTTKFNTNPLILRLTVNNLTDKEYWVNQYYLGDRRSIYASATLKF